MEDLDTLELISSECGDNGDIVLNFFKKPKPISSVTINIIINENGDVYTI